MDDNTHPVAALRPPVETPLRSIMREQGRTQKWLAEQIGVAASEVSDYCRGIHMPQPSTRAKIARALGRHERDVFPQIAVAA